MSLRQMAKIKKKNSVCLNYSLFLIDVSKKTISEEMVTSSYFMLITKFPVLGKLLKKSN